MTKKYIYILFLTIIILFITLTNTQNKNAINAFSENEDNYYFDTYLLNFNECDLNTNNFKEILSYFNNRDFKILEVVPYANVYNKEMTNKKFLYYTNDIDYILEDFKNKYIDKMIDNSSYVTNICIKNIKIMTSNKYINEFKNKILFSY